MSTTLSRGVGTIIKPLRMYTNEHLNREVRWDLHKETPSGWALEKPEPGPLREAGHKLYDLMRTRGDRGKKDAPEWGRQPEWTQAEDPKREPELPADEASSPAPEPEHDEGP